MIAEKQVLNESASYNVNTQISYFQDWHIELVRCDGTAVVNPSNGSNTPNVSFLRIEGIPYVHMTDGSARWYRVRTPSNKLIFNGEDNSWQVAFNLALTENVIIDQIVHTPPGCYSENMLIRMADGTDKPIGEVQPGDKIKSWNCIRNSDQEEIVDATVEYSSAGIVRVAPKYDKYTFSNGTIIEIVNRDRVYNIEDNKMKWMDRWEIGEHGLTYDGQEVALVSHEVINEPIKLHDFTSEYHNFFVNGMLAGQKRARYPFFPSRFQPNN